jgi:hypothetical protein
MMCGGIFFKTGQRPPHIGASRVKTIIFSLTNPSFWQTSCDQRLPMILSRTRKLKIANPSR